jgi:anti-sigma B factor antagonist
MNDTVLNFDIETHASVTILSPKGETKQASKIDIGNFGAMDEKLDEIVRDGCLNLLVDLSSIGYIDSTGVGMFMELIKTMDSKNGRFSLSGYDEKIKRIFKILKLDTKVSLFETKREALNELS